jgi:eukaryotic-like serine/threonine-protein kinase
VLNELQPGDPAQIGPYKLTAVLGAGGMGRVYLGWSAGGRPVAVKVIRAELAADAEFRARFRREVAAARTMNGVHTAPLVDADLDGPVPWLATAYVSGPSLAEAVTSYGSLPTSSLLGLAAGLAEALTAIHAAGLVHRDLKPSNVLLAPDGPRVIDFGISRAADTTSLTNTGQSMGSPGYLSPEQAIGKLVGPPTDIFSLGAVLTFAASGDGPFGEGSLPALVYRVVHEAPTLDGVPAELRDLIQRCLAKEPGDRPTASELLSDLAAVRPGAEWLPDQLGAALAGFAVAALPRTGPASVSAAGPVTRPPFERTATSWAAANAAPPAVPPEPRTPPPGSGPVRPSRSRLLRRGVVVPVASVVAVLAAAVVALVAILGGPGANGLPGTGPTESVSPLAASGHLLVSDAPTSKPAAGSSTPAGARQSAAGNPQSAAQPNAAAAAAPAVTVTQAAPAQAAPKTSGPSRDVVVTVPTTASPAPVTPTTPVPTTSEASPTPTPTATITPFQEIHYSGASTVSCSEDGTVASGPALVHVSLVVTNNTSTTIEVYWINLSRTLVLNADLLPGQTETFATDEGDYWMISRSTGACFDIFLLNQAATLTAF